MTTRVHLLPRTYEAILEFVLAHYDPLTFQSTVSDDDKKRILKKVHRLMDEGRKDDSSAALHEIPLTPPTAALALLEPDSSRKELRNCYNLADADKAFGADWLEMFEEYDGRCWKIGSQSR